MDEGDVRAAVGRMTTNQSKTTVVLGFRAIRRNSFLPYLEFVRPVTARERPRVQGSGRNGGRGGETRTIVALCDLMMRCN